MKKTITALVLGCFLFLSCLTAYAGNENAGKVNLNSATKEQLISVGITEEMATEILELREENEEFVDMDELLDVEGVDANFLRQLKKKMFIEEVKGCNC